MDLRKINSELEKNLFEVGKELEKQLLNQVKDFWGESVSDIADEGKFKIEDNVRNLAKIYKYIGEAVIEIDILLKKLEEENG